MNSYGDSMKENKFIKLLTIFIVVQPFFDVFVYFMDKIFNINIPFISFIRPIVAISIYLYLLFILELPLGVPILVC